MLQLKVAQLLQWLPKILPTPFYVIFIFQTQTNILKQTYIQIRAGALV